MDRPRIVRPRHIEAPPVRVQIVEDLPKVQALIRAQIEQDTRFVVTGIDDTEASALARFTLERPDVVIVDLNLREGSGLGLLHHVQLVCALPQRPLMVVVTNHTLSALRAASFRFGADHFLDKSHDLVHLGRLLAQTFYAA